DYNRKKKWKLKALAATSIAGGFLVFLYEKNWLEAIIKRGKLFPSFVIFSQLASLRNLFSF
ncbi:TPA: hypothetical protein ACGO32_002394, partial [Streptococcus suis]